MGLPADHPEKDGVMVDKANIVGEVKKTLARVEQGTTNGVNGVTEQLSSSAIS